MTDEPEHLGILAFGYADSLAGARLRGITQETNGARQEGVLDYEEMRARGPTRMSDEQGRIVEHIQGQYVPRRLRLVGVSRLECSGVYEQRSDAPLEHGARSLGGVVYWSIPGQPAKWAVFNGSPEPAELMLSFRRCRPEESSGRDEAVELQRDWAPAPPMPARMVSLHKRVHGQYGGDPVRLRLNGKVWAKRMFLGGLNDQGGQ